MQKFRKRAKHKWKSYMLCCIPSPRCSLWACPWPSHHTWNLRKAYGTIGSSCPPLHWCWPTKDTWCYLQMTSPHPTTIPLHCTTLNDITRSLLNDAHLATPMLANRTKQCKKCYVEQTTKHVPNALHENRLTKSALPVGVDDTDEPASCGSSACLV